MESIVVIILTITDSISGVIYVICHADHAIYHTVQFTKPAVQRGFTIYVS